LFSFTITVTPRTSIVSRRTCCGALAGPGLAARAIGSVGQDFLPQPGQIFTTVAKAQRLGGNAVGLAAWEAPAITKSDGGALWVTATPARHGPA